jgi:hypothetical protein
MAVAAAVMYEVITHCTPYRSVDKGAISFGTIISTMVVSKIAIKTPTIKEKVKKTRWAVLRLS